MLSTKIRNELESTLNLKIKQYSSVGGGCIAECYALYTHQGPAFFLKTLSPTNIFNMFHAEAEGLREIAHSKTISVPKVILESDNYLLLEFIPPTNKEPYFWRNFGILYAKMHQHNSPNLGFHLDNYCGLTPQINTPQIYSPDGSSWPEFYYQYRLLHQFKLAEKNGYATSDLRHYMLQLEGKISSILSGSQEPPSLLHGDLWSENFIIGPQNKAYLIDPAAYYGHREADLAMTKLFGGFDNEFYQAYEQAFPLSEGAAEREPIYKLYHILNHLNLFGQSYYSQAINLLKSYF